ncbi:MAG: hypothetical protein ACXVBW_00355, partial [Bdellovibrionota bacterium]
GMYEPGLACGEDTLFSARLARRGEPMLFDPGIRIIHPGPRTLREFAACACPDFLMGGQAPQSDAVALGENDLA